MGRSRAPLHVRAGQWSEIMGTLSLATIWINQWQVKQPFPHGVLLFSLTTTKLYFTKLYSLILCAYKVPQAHFKTYPRTARFSKITQANLLWWPQSSFFTRSIIAVVDKLRDLHCTLTQHSGDNTVCVLLKPANTGMPTKPEMPQNMHHLHRSQHGKSCSQLMRVQNSSSTCQDH